MKCKIEINREALLYNYRLFSKIASSSVIVPVLKSNAYGHGLEEVYEILAEKDPEWIGVFYLEEAQKLRELGFQRRIMVMGGVTKKQFPLAEKLSAEVFMVSDQMLLEWKSSESKPDFHLKFDTGMGRQGFSIDRAEQLCDELQPYRRHLKGICSHFANVEDVLDDSYAREQLELIRRVARLFKDRNFNFLSHIASSASTLILKDSQMDLVRVGISLYGLWPSRVTRLSYNKLSDSDLELRPVLAWKSEIAMVKSLAAGKYIGYGCSFRTTKETKIAVIPVGYYEGYPRQASNKSSYVLIHDLRCPILGRICMNMMMVDVSHVDNALAGDEVCLIGAGNNESLSVETLSEWSDTINYAVVTCLNENIKREIVG